MIRTPQQLRAFITDYIDLCRRHNMCLGYDDRPGVYEVYANTTDDDFVPDFDSTRLIEENNFSGSYGEELGTYIYSNDVWTEAK